MKSFRFFVCKTKVLMKYQKNFIEESVWVLTTGGNWIRKKFSTCGWTLWEFSIFLVFLESYCLYFGAKIHVYLGYVSKYPNQERN